MQGKKIFGWLLLLVGLVIIFWTFSTSYSIFTGKRAVWEIFKVEEKAETEGVKTQDFEEQMREMVKEQFKEMLPAEFLPRLFNLIVWAIFSGIAIFAGAQISSLGIKLLRAVKIQQK